MRRGYGPAHPSPSALREPLTCLPGQRRPIRLCVVALLVLVARIGTADWSPPSNPNPSLILDEAEADTAAGRYGDALAKHLWFHQNALKYAPAMYGVRLSFALSSWKTLACLYPPALEQLRAVRDEAGAAVRAGEDPRHAFHDFVSINRELDEEPETRNLFLWLDANNSFLARQLFDVALPALVEQKQYQVCGRYLDPQRSWNRTLSRYRESMELARDPELEDMKSFAEQSFAYEAATLVALLVLNDRRADAEGIAAQARSALPGPTLAGQLDAALRGTCPERWP